MTAALDAEENETEDEIPAWEEAIEEEDATATPALEVPLPLAAGFVATGPAEDEALFVLVAIELREPIPEGRGTSSKEPSGLAPALELAFGAGTSMKVTT